MDMDQFQAILTRVLELGYVLEGIAPTGEPSQYIVLASYNKSTDDAKWVTWNVVWEGPGLCNVAMSWGHYHELGHPLTTAIQARRDFGERVKRGV